MNIPTKREMRWFVQRLIDIRDDVGITPDHITNINFDYKEIEKQKGIFNINDKEVAKNKTEEMLYRIKNDGEFLDKFNHFDEKRLSWELPIASRDSIIIKGYQRGLLSFYLKENILKGEKVFGFTVNDKGQQVILVYGDNTEQRIESQEQFRAFCYFLSHQGKTIKYLELFEEFKRGTTHDGAYYNTKYPTSDDRKNFVQTTVYNLKRKLIELSKRYDIDIDKILQTFSKEGYIYNDGSTTV